MKKFAVLILLLFPFVVSCGGKGGGTATNSQVATNVTAQPEANASDYVGLIYIFTPKSMENGDLGDWPAIANEVENAAKGFNIFVAWGNEDGLKSVKYGNPEKIIDLESRLTMSELTECGYVLSMKDYAPIYLKWDSQDDMVTYIKEYFEISD